MKLKLLSVSIFWGMFLCANAQIDLEKRIKKEDVVKGIIYKDGKETEGYIKRIAEKRTRTGKTYKAYDNFQYEIRFMPKDQFEKTEKLKGNMYEKYKPTEIQGYKYFSPSGDVYIYESVKYSDLANLSARMAPKETFLRVESKGNMEVYTYYIPVPSVMAGSEEYFKKCYEDAETPQRVFRKAGNTESPKMAELLNVEKDLADCPKVVEKYKNGEYNTIGKKGTESKFMKFVNKVSANDEIKFGALMDYNSGICNEKSDNEAEAVETVEVVEAE